MLAQGWEMFRTQGPVFWGAAAAVALGATLLLMTVYAFLRQAVRRGRGNRWLRGRAAVAGAGAGVLTVDDTGYRFAGAKEASAKRGSVRGGRRAAGQTPAGIHGEAGVQAAPHEPYHEQLWARLRAAGDRLEACQENLGTQDPCGWESPLKGGPSAVEYVFRKGIG